MKVMKRLEEKDARQYIPLKEDYTSKEASYFTLTPLEDGWHQVTYYTNRKLNTYTNRGKGDTWVYILENELMPGLLKIGYTKLLPEERAKQISSSTGVATPFKVSYAFQCFNAEGLERELHKFFEEYRVSNNREFFRLSLDEAQKAVKNLGQRYL